MFGLYISIYTDVMRTTGGMRHLRAFMEEAQAANYRDSTRGEWLRAANLVGGGEAFTRAESKRVRHAGREAFHHFEMEKDWFGGMFYGRPIYSAVFQHYNSPMKQMVFFKGEDDWVHVKLEDEGTNRFDAETAKHWVCDGVQGLVEFISLRLPHLT